MFNSSKKKRYSIYILDTVYDIEHSPHKATIFNFCATIYVMQQFGGFKRNQSKMFVRVVMRVCSLEAT